VITQLLQSADADIAEAKHAPLLGALKSLTADANAPVRTAAGKCYWALHTLRPSESDELFAKLEPAQQKMLKRCRPS